MTMTLCGPASEGHRKSRIRQPTVHHDYDFRPRDVPGGKEKGFADGPSSCPYELELVVESNEVVPDLSNGIISWLDPDIKP